MKIKKVVSFPLGQVVATPAALAALDKNGQSAGEFIDRHSKADWGVVPEEDWKANDEALKIGERLFSAYSLKDNTKIWIISERDRSATTVLLPEDY